MNFAYYDRQGKPISLVQAAAMAYLKRVAYDKVGDIEVSTVWLGLDHSMGEGPPLIFETMIFGGPHNEEQWRYSTEADAIAGHHAVVKALQSGADLPE